MDSRIAMRALGLLFIAGSVASFHIAPRDSYLSRPQHRPLVIQSAGVTYPRVPRRIKAGKSGQPRLASMYAFSAALALRGITGATIAQPIVVSSGATSNRDVLLGRMGHVSIRSSSLKGSWLTLSDGFELNYAPCTKAGVADSASTSESSSSSGDENALHLGWRPLLLMLGPPILALLALGQAQALVMGFCSQSFGFFGGLWALLNLMVLLPLSLEVGWVAASLIGLGVVGPGEAALGGKPFVLRYALNVSSADCRARLVQPFLEQLLGAVVRRAPLVQAAAAVWAGGDLTGKLAAATSFALHNCKVVLEKSSSSSGGGRNNKGQAENSEGVVSPGRERKARLVFEGTANFPDDASSALDFTLRLSPTVQAVEQQVNRAAPGEFNNDVSRRALVSGDSSSNGVGSSGNGSGGLVVRSKSDTSPGGSSSSSGSRPRTVVIDALVAADPEVRAFLNELTVWGQKLPDLWVPLGSSGVGVGLGPKHVLHRVSGKALSTDRGAVDVGASPVQSPAQSSGDESSANSPRRGFRSTVASVFSFGRSGRNGDTNSNVNDPEEEGLLFFQGSLFRNGARPPAKKRGGLLAMPV